MTSHVQVCYERIFLLRLNKNHNFLQGNRLLHKKMLVRKKLRMLFKFPASLILFLWFQKLLCCLDCVSSSLLPKGTIITGMSSQEAMLKNPPLFFQEFFPLSALLDSLRCCVWSKLKVVDLQRYFLLKSEVTVRWLQVLLPAVCVLGYICAKVTAVHLPQVTKGKQA